MTDQDIKFVRRNRVDERYALAIATFAGLVALAAPASPTGSTVPDAIIVFAAAMLVTWAGASAPWWAVAAASGIAAAIAIQPLVAVVGLIGFLIGLHVGLFRSDDAELRAVAAGIGVNALLLSELGGFFGLSAIIGITVGAALTIIGVRRRKRFKRRRVWVGAGIVAGCVVLSVAAAAVAGASARNDLTAAARTARSGVQAVERGDYAEGARLLDEAAIQFSLGADRLGGPLAMPAMLVPGVAQNVSAGADLSESAASATRTAADALDLIDVDALTVSGGAIDLDALDTAGVALLDVRAALLDLGEASDRVRSPWLVGALQRELDELDAEIADNDPKLQNAIEAVQLAPDLLGRTEPQTYLLLFTTPTEARGTAGFIGNWAELTITDGRIEMTGFGRTTELNQSLRDNPIVCECPAEYLNAYGQYGFREGPDLTVSRVAFSNVTIGAHFPYVAQTVAAIYPTASGQPALELDGVIAVDPYVVAQFMEYTGPIDVPELDVTVAAPDAAEFLLVEQYRLAEEKQIRVEALETLGTEAILRLLTSGLPDPTVLARDLGPLAEENRLVVWAADPAAGSFFDRIGLDGGLPAYDASLGGFGMTVVNGSANKIESFLEREVSVEIVGEPAARELVATVRLTNNAPTEGFPRYVIGNSIGLPDGSSRLIVNLFGTSFGEISIDGEPVAAGTFLEAGWSGQRVDVELESGESAVLMARYALPGTISGADLTPTVWEQPLRR